MRKSSFLLAVIILLGSFNSFTSAESVPSIQISNPRITTGDITWNSAIITFDLIVRERAKELQYLKILFWSERPNLSFAIILGEPIKTSESEKKVEIRGLSPNCPYLVEFCLVDQNGNILAALEEKIIFKTERKPIEIKKWAAYWQENSAILNLSIETDGINQFCEPLKAMIRLGGMCPCREEILDECTKQTGKNYCETIMDQDGEIAAQFDIPERYRGDISGFFMIFEYKNPDNGEMQMQQTPIIQIRPENR
ncbi:MAG TPA: hypothetical protein PKM84_00495 [Candidatus Pacearchaeota archaeon]|nr:hypothetical protein [Candidatus Pacearchaeota archaeon]